MTDALAVYAAYEEFLANAPLNLVSRNERAVVRERHIEEARAVVPFMDIAAGSRWLDIGTGGGLPGVVLAVECPATHFTLVDATRKKVDALTAFVSKVGLANVQVVHGRAEALARTPGLRASFDGVVMRAVAPLVIGCELARGFLVAGGRFVAIKGPRWEEELPAVTPVLEKLQMSFAQTTSVPAVPRATRLVTMRAEGDPPDWVPRADGVPRAQPLRGRRL